MFRWLKKSTAVGSIHRTHSEWETEASGWRDGATETAEKAYRARPAIRSSPRRPADAPRDVGYPSPTSVPLSLRLEIVAPSVFIKGNASLTRVASAYLRNWYCLVPSGTSLRGLKVRVLPLRCDRPVISGPIHARFRWINLTGQRTQTYRSA